MLPHELFLQDSGEWNNGDGELKPHLFTYCSVTELRWQARKGIQGYWMAYYPVLYKKMDTYITATLNSMVVRQ